LKNKGLVLRYSFAVDTSDSLARIFLYPVLSATEKFSGSRIAEFYASVVPLGHSYQKTAVTKHYTM